jgi:hypothetical protein
LGGIPRARTIVLGSAVIALAALVIFALQREITQPMAQRPVAMTLRAPEARALTPEEEDYAAALWVIHREVKVSAVELSLAGIAYKTESHDVHALEAKVQPLANFFSQAEFRARALDVPPSMQKVQDQYVEAVALYERAAGETLKVREDDRDQHLLDAQSMSQQASENLLRVGDVLWPAEYKPN